MRVELCVRTNDMPEGKIKVRHCESVPEAMKAYKEFKDLLGDKLVKAYLRRFEGYHYYTHKVLLEEKKS